MLNDAQTYMTRYPWVAVFPGLMIFITVLSVNFVGDGLRDAFDPRTTK
jgi:peptide/nickel transport system permease protein